MYLHLSVRSEAAEIWQEFFIAYNLYRVQMYLPYLFANMDFEKKTDNFIILIELFFYSTEATCSIQVKTKIVTFVQKGCSSIVRLRPQQKVQEEIKWSRYSCSNREYEGINSG